MTGVDMNLNDAQKKQVSGWIDEGLKLSDIQKRISSEFGLTLTYMDVRLLVDDLKLVPKDPVPAPTPVLPAAQPKPAPAAAAPPGANTPLAPEPAAANEPGSGTIGGKVAVVVDTVARPGAMVSGSVTFSDGQKGGWYLDQYGRLGVVPDKQGYKPAAADVQTFQMELEKELSRMGF